MSKDTRPWIKVSVDMWRHPKITQLTAAQFRTLIALWSLAMEYRTDGDLDVRFVRSQGLTMGSLRAIADTGLGWFSDDESVFHLHDYLDHQSSAEQLEAKTNQRRSAGRRGGLAKAESARSRTPTRAPSTAPPTRVQGPHLDAQVQRLLSDKQQGQDTSGLSGPLSGPLSDTRGHARAAEVEEEKEHLPPPSDDDRYVTRANRQSSSTFSDGTPIPPEPPADPRTDGALALDHDAEIIPIEIGTAARPRPTRAEPAHRSTVRLVLGAAGYPDTTIGQLAIQVAKLAGRHPHGLIVEALREWDRRPDVKPSYLPSVLGDVVKQQRAQPAASRSTTDERIAAIQALKHRPTTNHRSLE